MPGIIDALVTQKRACCAALLSFAPLCQAAEPALLDLSRRVGSEASYAVTIPLSCQADPADAKSDAIICSNGEPDPETSASRAHDMVWIKLRGKTLAYWIRFRSSQIVEFGADADAFVVPAQTARTAGSMLRFRIALPPLQP